MGIYIKGLKAPESCSKCRLSGWSNYYQLYKCDVCDQAVAKYASEYQMAKPDWCPLVEIKEPHGDLIDRDALVKDLTNGIKAGLLLDGYEKYQNINNTDDCVECVKYADAVIEAEESVNE